MKINGPKILYIGIPFHSHVNPSLGIIKGLVDSDHQVLFQGIGKLSPEFEFLGAQNISSTGFLFNPEPQTVTSPFKIIHTLLEATSKLVPELNEVIKKELPDCIIHDHFCLWGKIVAKQNDLPAISLVTTLVLSPSILLKYWRTLPFGMHVSLSDLFEIPKIGSYLIDLKQKGGLDHFKITDFLINPEPLNLVFTSKFFQPLGDTFDSSYKFIGPSVYPRSKSVMSGWRKNPKRKTLYLCFGTMHNTLNLYKKCLEILQNTPYQVIVSVGNRINIKDLGPFSKNIQVRNFVPQLEILPKVDAFISHGGMNSVSESLYFGVPLLMIPLLNEQIINANRVQELGAGIILNQNQVNRTNLTHAIRKILTDDSFKKNAKRIRDSFLDAGGYKRGAEEINNHLSFGQRDKIKACPENKKDEALKCY